MKQMLLLCALALMSAQLQSEPQPIQKQAYMARLITCIKNHWVILGVSAAALVYGLVKTLCPNRPAMDIGRPTGFQHVCPPLEGVATEALDQFVEKNRRFKKLEQPGEEQPKSEGPDTV